MQSSDATQQHAEASNGSADHPGHRIDCLDAVQWLRMAAVLQAMYDLTLKPNFSEF
jgi:hypothetical protein